MRLLLQKAGYTPETVQALGEKYDEELTAPAIEVIKEKIESIQNNREVDLSSPEEVKKALNEIISGSSIDDFRDFKFGERPAAAEDIELEELI